MADRAGYGDRQAELLAALQRGAPAPDRFDPDAVTAAGAALVRKRAAAVREAWPALTHDRGDAFAGEFAAHCRRHPPPADGGGIADGYRYARELPARTLNQSARAELAMRRGALVLRGGAVAHRRGPFLTAVALRRPLGLLVVCALPGLGSGHLTLGRRRH